MVDAIGNRFLWIAKIDTQVRKPFIFLWAFFRISSIGCEPTLEGPLPSLHSSLSIPCPPLPYKYAQLPTSIQLGVWGSAVSSSSGSGAEPQSKLNLVHFSVKMCHLVATNLMIFLRIK